VLSQFENEIVLHGKNVLDALEHVKGVLTVITQDAHNLLGRIIWKEAQKNDAQLHLFRIGAAAGQAHAEVEQPLPRTCFRFQSNPYSFAQFNEVTADWIMLQKMTQDRICQYGVFFIDKVFQDAAAFLRQILFAPKRNPFGCKDVQYIFLPSRPLILESIRQTGLFFTQPADCLENALVIFQMATLLSCSLRYSISLILPYITERHYVSF